MAGARGIVSAGLAPGIPAPLERTALQRAAKAGVVVVQASRAGSGRVARRRYLREAGIVGADNLNPHKARILLMLALTRSSDADDIQRMFDTVLTGSQSRRGLFAPIPLPAVAADIQEWPYPAVGGASRDGPCRNQRVTQ